MKELEHIQRGAKNNWGQPHYITRVAASLVLSGHTTHKQSVVENHSKGEHHEERS